ncbi:MAG: hypothetical protein KGI57_12165, partial [Hyphomicrobiales bacterium]|nr:hypothetical protein [Hyphomicrobiales bacterium]
QVAAASAQTLAVAPTAPSKADPTKPGAPVDPTAATTNLSQADSALAQAAPTAGFESAGIGATAQNGASLVSAGQGAYVEIVGADGVKRKVRVVGP